MSRAGGFPPVFLTGLPIIQVNVLRTYTPTQIMFPPATMILAKQPIWSFPLHCACSRGCTICVDTLHYLCRVCFERPLFKGILYSWNVPFCRIDSFYRLILFRIMFRIKGGIYTNNVPPLRQWFLRNNQFGHSRCIALVPGVHDLCRYPALFV